MRNRRTTLLAGIAAFALIAGTGLVAAQETSQGNKSTMQPHAGGTNMKTEKEGAGGKMGQSTQSGKMGEKQGGESTHAQGMQNGKMGENESSSEAESKTGKNAERLNKSTAEGGKSSETRRGEGREEKYGEEKKGSKEKLGEGKANEGKMNEGRAAKGERNKEGASTAEQGRNGSRNAAEDQRMHGLQGNASHVTLNDQQRTRIRDTVINARGAPRVGSVDFDVAIGTAIPRDRVHIVPVPESLVEIDPAWRGYRYFIYEDEIVIVDPEDMRIIAVLPV